MALPGHGGARSTPGAVGAAACRSRAPRRDDRGPGARQRAARHPRPARRPAVGAAEDRQRLRPAVRVLRHPDVPRRVRLPPPHRRRWPRPAGWGSAASRSSSSSARTPRRTARTSATCGCSRRCCPSWPRSPGIERVRVSYLQPAEIRPDLLDAMASTPGRRALLRHLLPARLASRCCARMRRFGCARGVPRPARAGARRARRWPASASNVIVGFPGETEAGPRRARGVPRRGAARRRRRVRLLRRGRHRGRGATATSCPRTSSPSGSSASPRLVEELNRQRAEERIGETVEVLVEEVERRGRRPSRSAGPRTRARTSTASPCCAPDGVAGAARRRHRARRGRRHRGHRPRRGAAMTRVARPRPAAPGDAASPVSDRRPSRAPGTSPTP